jgi:hypothetical protein
MFGGGARQHYTQKVGVPGHPGTNGNYAYGWYQRSISLETLTDYGELFDVLSFIIQKL